MIPSARISRSENDYFTREPAKTPKKGKREGFPRKSDVFEGKREGKRENVGANVF